MKISSFTFYDILWAFNVYKYRCSIILTYKRGILYNTRPHIKKGCNQNMNIYIRDHCLYVVHAYTQIGTCLYICKFKCIDSDMYYMFVWSLNFPLHWNMCVFVYACNIRIGLFTLYKCIFIIFIYQLYLIYLALRNEDVTLCSVWESKRLVCDFG